MSKAKYIKDTNPRVYQWVTDDEPCEPLNLQNHSSIIVQVNGDLSQDSVIIRGGLLQDEADNMPFLKEITVSSSLTIIPSVSWIVPVTQAKGVTISIKGLP